MRPNAHVEAIEGHPGGSICLSKNTTCRERLRPIESSNVIETQKSALEYVITTGVFTINPPASRQSDQHDFKHTLATNHVKFNKSFWKTLSKNCTSSFPNSFLSILNTRNVAQACTGGLTSLKFHSYAGIWPSGFIYHSRTSNFSCCFANAGSTIANGMQWNAVSHAAKNGYSHLSGMERISAICRWRQS